MSAVSMQTHLQRLHATSTKRVRKCSCLVFAVLLLLLLQAEFGRLDVRVSNADGGQEVAGHLQLLHAH
jgi:hypothetical protein